jgi:hypothetical protein
MRTSINRLGLVVVLFALGSGCGRSQPPPYVPELGELMLLQQVRHTKLWLAGNAGNWPLANYEVQELDEGFDTILTYHPTHDESPVAPKDAIPRMVKVPLADLREAVQSGDAKLFAERYDALTAACNNCHQASNVGFNRVQRPETNPFPNQVFSPPGDANIVLAPAN